MQKTYKFRLYPSRQLEKKLLWTLDKCRFVYNHMLEGLNGQDKPNRLVLQDSIPRLKEDYPELQDVYSKVLQYEPYRLFSNLKALGQLKRNGKKVGRLRFKGREWFKTFTYNQSGFKIIMNGKRCQTLHLSKIGDIPIRMHRTFKGKIKQVTIKRYASGKWFASITAETKEEIRPTQNKNKVGIDLGLNSFVHDSDNNRIDHPRCLNKSLRKLAKEEKRLSKRKKGSKNRAKQKVKVARIHEKIVNQRDDFLHKSSRHYVDNYGFIAFEKLNIRGMVRNHYLARSITDASWSRFIQMLEYKAESAGVQVMEVDARNTTQKCSQCGKAVKKSLAVRTHKCYCGFVADRDYNSALNILQRALRQELSEFTPVETEPLPVGASSVAEAGSHFLKSV